MKLPTHHKTRMFSILLFVLLLLAGPAAAQNGPALWSIEKNDVTMYLFGTIHLMKEDVQWYEGDIKEAFERSDMLIVEVNQASLSREAKVKTIRDLALLPSNAQLGDLISDERIAALKSMLEPLGVPEKAIQSWRPWYAALTVAGTAARQAGFLPEHGVDVTLLSKAREREMKIQQLETFHEQLSLFADLDREEAVYFLTDSLEERDEMQALFEKLKRNWLKDNSSALRELLQESARENPDFYAKVYEERNKRWLSKIENLIEEGTGTYFVAVGAGHLLGDEGLLELLRQRGCEVEKE